MENQTQEPVAQQNTDSKTPGQSGNAMNVMLMIGIVVLLIVIALLGWFLWQNQSSGDTNVNPNPAGSTQSSSSSSALTGDDYLNRLEANVQVGNTIELKVDNMSPAPGDKVVVNLVTKMTVQNEGDNVASLVVNFDPAKFKALSFESGEVLIKVGDELDNQAGVVKMDVANNEPFTDNTVLATLTLETIVNPTGSSLALGKDSQLGVPNSLVESAYQPLTF